LNQPKSKDDLDAVRLRGQRDPAWWVETILGCGLWSKQREIIEALRDHKHVVVKSCNASGKSYLAARAAHQFLYNHQPSIVITTAPTQRQVRGILWKEIRTAHANARYALGGKPNLGDLTLRENWFALGFTAAEYSADKFQGFHERDMLAIVDESCGISSEINEGIDALLTSDGAHRLDIGNPTDPLSDFAKMFTADGVVKFTISAFDTPNFTAFGITEADIADGSWRAKIGVSPLPYPALITPEWVADKHHRWGPTNPIYLARVKAEFPSGGRDNLITMAMLEAAQRRELVPSEPVVLGVDVARYGDDQCAIYCRRGPVVRLVKRFGKSDTMETTGKVVIAAAETKATRACVDVVGLGAGVVDRLREIKPTFSIVEANAGGAAVDNEVNLNARADWYMSLRERFESGDIDIDPADDDLAAELVEIRWKPDSRGRNTIEPKDEMKRRLGRSPDSADAVAMAFMATDSESDDWSGEALADGEFDTAGWNVCDYPTQE